MKLDIEVTDARRMRSSADLAYINHFVNSASTLKPLIFFADFEDLVTLKV
jgi:hypothetical protein